MKGVGNSPLPSYASGGYYFKAQDASSTSVTICDGLWTVTDDSAGGAVVAKVYVHNACQFWGKSTAFNSAHVYTWTWSSDPYGGDPHQFDVAVASTTTRYVCRAFASYS